MPKLKNMSGQDIITILEVFGFSIIKQKGSHIKLRRVIDNKKETLTIPNHNELDKGTLKAIIRQASNYISSYELTKYFYHEQ